MLTKGTLLWSATSTFLYFMQNQNQNKKLSMRSLLRDSTVYKNTWQPRGRKHDSWKLFCRICVFVCGKQKQIIVHLRSSEEPHPLKHTDTSKRPHASASHFLLLWSAVFKHSASLSSLINGIIIPKPAAVDIFNNKHRTEQNSAFRAAESRSGVCLDRPSYESSLLPQTSPDASAAGMRTMTGIPGFSQIWPVGTSASSRSNPRDTPARTTP